MSAKCHTFHTSLLDGGGQLYALEPLGSNGKDVGCATYPVPNAVANTKIPSGFCTVLPNETHKINFS